MQPTRRALLGGLAAFSLLPACGVQPGPLPEAEWVPPGTEDEASFPFGVQVGDVTPDSAVVSVRGAEAGASLVLALAARGGWEEVARFPLTANAAGVAQLVLTDLFAAAHYRVVALSADGARRSVLTQLRTAPAPGEAPVLRFGATSCLGGNRPWPSMSAVAAEGVDAFFLLGDTIYNDWGAGSLQAKWDTALEQAGMRDLSAVTSFVATWDDHEVWNNWDAEDDDDAALAVEALAAFRDAVPQGSGPQGGVWRSLRWGDTAEVFVLDCRSERFGRDYMSDAQLQWLKEGLVASPCRFKLVLNSVPITDLSSFGVIGSYGASDRWQGHADQRSELLEHLRENGVQGVLWVSGDFHVGAIARVDAPGGPADDQWEVLTGPGGSPIDDRYSLVPESERFPAVVTQHNSVIFELDPASGAVLVRFIGDDGAELRRMVL